MVDHIAAMRDAIPGSAFTDAEFRNMLKGSDHSRYGIIKRAIANGALIHLRRGLYALSRRNKHARPNLFEIAMKLYAPSYISLETALSYHGLIPEGVRAITCTSAKRSREFTTPLGVFSYTRIPTFTYVGVNRVVMDEAPCFIATPEKALADYVYVHKKQWTTIGPLIEDLRIDEEDLHGLSKTMFEELRSTYRNRRVTAFIDGVMEGLTS